MCRKTWNEIKQLWVMVLDRGHCGFLFSINIQPKKLAFIYKCNFICSYVCRFVCLYSYRMLHLAIKEPAVWLACRPQEKVSPSLSVLAGLHFHWRHGPTSSPKVACSSFSCCSYILSSKKSRLEVLSSFFAHIYLSRGWQHSLPSQIFFRILDSDASAYANFSAISLPE